MLNSYTFKEYCLWWDKGMESTNWERVYTSKTFKTGRYIALCNIYNIWNKPKTGNKKPYFLPYTRNQALILNAHDR